MTGEPTGEFLPNLDAEGSHPRVRCFLIIAGGVEEGHDGKDPPVSERPVIRRGAGSLEKLLGVFKRHGLHCHLRGDEHAADQQ